MYYSEKLFNDFENNSQYLVSLQLQEYHTILFAPNQSTEYLYPQLMDVTSQKHVCPQFKKITQKHRNLQKDRYYILVAI